MHASKRRFLAAIRAPVRTEDQIWISSNYQVFLEGFHCPGLHQEPALNGRAWSEQT